MACASQPWKNTCSNAPAPVFEHHAMTQLPGWPRLASALLGVDLDDSPWSAYAARIPTNRGRNRHAQTEGGDTAGIADPCAPTKTTEEPEPTVPEDTRRNMVQDEGNDDEGEREGTETTTTTDNGNGAPCFPWFVEWMPLPDPLPPIGNFTPTFTPNPGPAWPGFPESIPTGELPRNLGPPGGGAGSDTPPKGGEGDGPRWGGGDEAHPDNQCQYAENCSYELCMGLAEAQERVCKTARTCKTQGPNQGEKAWVAYGAMRTSCANARRELAKVCWGMFTDQPHRDKYNQEVDGIEDCRKIFEKRNGKYPVPAMPTAADLGM